MPTFTEINNLAFPYTTVVYIVTTFPDGARSQGTGVLVGRNDVLTAGHVIYDSAHGGLASAVEVTPGYDSTPVERPYGILRAAAWTARTDFDPDGDGRLVAGDGRAGTGAGSEQDIGVIGLDRPIGDRIGWMAVDYDHRSGTVNITGYPGNQRGNPVSASGTSAQDRVDWFYDISSFPVSPGNSGGPVWYSGGAGPAVVGLVSTGLAAVDVGGHRVFIEQALAGNDTKIKEFGTSLAVVGSGAGDVFRDQAEAETVYGLTGLDVFASTKARAAAAVTVETGAGGVKVSVASGGATDVLVDVERVRFTDAVLAFDLNGNAGTTYRLYEAAFDRTPDTPGLSGNVRLLDAGTVNAHGLADAFVTSAEFTALYGPNASDEAFVTALYRNVLERAPDQAGLRGWLDVLRSGRGDRADLLFGFSESTENKAAVASAIRDGILLDLGAVA